MGYVTFKSIDVKKDQRNCKYNKRKNDKTRRDRKGAGTWKCPPMRSGTIISKIKDQN